MIESAAGADGRGLPGHGRRLFGEAYGALERVLASSGVVAVDGTCGGLVKVTHAAGDGGVYWFCEAHAAAEPDKFISPSTRSKSKMMGGGRMISYDEMLRVHQRPAAAAAISAPTTPPPYAAPPVTVGFAHPS